MFKWSHLHLTFTMVTEASVIYKTWFLSFLLTWQSQRPPNEHCLLNSPTGEQLCMFTTIAASSCKEVESFYEQRLQMWFLELILWSANWTNIPLEWFLSRQTVDLKNTFAKIVLWNAELWAKWTNGWFLFLIFTVCAIIHCCWHWTLSFHCIVLYCIYVYSQTWVTRRTHLQ